MVQRWSLQTFNFSLINPQLAHIINWYTPPTTVKQWFPAGEVNCPVRWFTTRGFELWIIMISIFFPPLFAFSVNYLTDLWLPMVPHILLSICWHDGMKMKMQIEVKTLPDAHSTTSVTMTIHWYISQLCHSMHKKCLMYKSQKIQSPNMSS